MIEMMYNKQGAYYFAFLRELNDSDVACKFDTGAVATIVTAKRLGLSCEQIEAVREYCDRAGIKPKKFYSATDGVMYGYPVKASNVRINVTSIGEFYYYLILDDKLDKALLGDDFISCCTFNHQPKGNITITTVNLGLYAATYGNETDFININEVLA